MAPAFSLLWALALVRLLRPFITILKEAPVILRRKMRLEVHVGREFSGVFIVMTLLLLIFTFVLPSPMSMFPRVLDHAYSPTTIAAASLPMKDSVSDWLDVVNWIRVNLPPSPPDGPTVVACWWDYGYWITIMANRTTLADNGTVNVTQISNIGRMFLSNETEAIKMLRTYDVTHVVVFTTFSQDGTDVGWAEEGKWRWMARIGGLNESEYGNTTEEGKWTWNDLGKSTVLYKLMQYGRDVTLQGSSTIQLEYFEESYFSQSVGSPRSYGGVIPLVCVYKVIYP